MRGTLALEIFAIVTVAAWAGYLWCTPRTIYRPGKPLIDEAWPKRLIGIVFAGIVFTPIMGALALGSVVTNSTAEALGCIGSVVAFMVVGSGSDRLERFLKQDAYQRRLADWKDAEAARVKKEVEAAKVATRAA